MFVPEGWEEEKKLNCPSSLTTPVSSLSLPDPPELGIHAFLPDSLEKYHILSVCSRGLGSSSKPPAISLLSQESGDSSPLIPAFVSGLDGVITVAYIRLLGGQHCKWGRGRERRRGLKRQWEKFKHAWNWNPERTCWNLDWWEKSIHGCVGGKRNVDGNNTSRRYRVNTVWYDVFAVIGHITIYVQHVLLSSWDQNGILHYFHHYMTGKYGLKWPVFLYIPTSLWDISVISHWSVRLLLLFELSPR